MKKKEYDWKIPLEKCKAHINIIEHEHQGWGVAFLNIQLPDGRWVTFKNVESEHIPIYVPDSTESKKLE